MPVKSPVLSDDGIGGTFADELNGEWIGGLVPIFEFDLQLQGLARIEGNGGDRANGGRMIDWTGLGVIGIESPFEFSVIGNPVEIPIECHSPAASRRYDHEEDGVLFSRCF